jgi:hypothetical protein
MNLKKLIATASLLAILATVSAPARAQPWFEQGTDFLGSTITYVQENAIPVLVAGGVVLAGILTYRALRGRVPAAEPVVEAVVQAVHRVAPHAVARPNPVFIDDNLNAAIQQSLKEERRRKELDMGAADLGFNENVFAIYKAQDSFKERIRFLKAILYHHDQVFVRHNVLAEFAALDLSLEETVRRFHQLKGRSLLTLVSPEVAEIDPAQTPNLNFEALQADYEMLKAIHATGGTLIDARLALHQRQRHAVENAIFEYVLKRLWFPALLTDLGHQRAELIIEELFGDQLPEELPELEPVAFAAPLVQPALAELSKDELRRRRLAQFGN